MSAEFRVQVEPGDGVVARFGPVVGVVAGTVSQRVRELLELLEQLGGAGAQLEAQRFLRDLLAWLAQADDEAMPAVGAIALLEDDLVVVLHGSMECGVRKPDEDLTLRGRDAAVSLNVVLDGPFSRAVLHPEGVEPSEEQTVYQLTAGVVPGTAAVATPLPQREAAAPDTAEVPEAQPAPLQAGEREPAPAAGGQRAPLPTAVEEVAQEAARAEAGAAPTDEAGELVDGIECPDGHFNHPYALTCSVCGKSLLDSARHTVKGPRQPLGTLSFDDGTTYDLVDNYVIGREPEQDPAVQDRQATAVRLEDPEHLISRVHADIRLVGWDVQVVDRGSANGTFVLPPEASEWQRLVGDEPCTISPGTRVAIGRKVITYEL